MKCNFKFQECLCEDGCSHNLHGVVFDVDLPIHYGLANEVETYANMFCVNMIVVICSKVKCSLIVAVESG